jgi:hypothetical protein
MADPVLVRIGLHIVSRPRKMLVTLRLLLLFAFYFTSGSAVAFSDRYDCEVKQIIKLDDAGGLSDATSNSPKASLYKPLLGKTFVVDRSTGNVQGSKWFNTSELERITIISDGRGQNAFRVLYVGGPPASVTTFLYIRETAKDEQKPFIMVDSSFAELTFGGTCK